MAVTPRDPNVRRENFSVDGQFLRIDSTSYHASNVKTIYIDSINKALKRFRRGEEDRRNLYIVIPVCICVAVAGAFANAIAPAIIGGILAVAGIILGASLEIIEHFVKKIYYRLVIELPGKKYILLEDPDRTVVESAQKKLARDLCISTGTTYNITGSQGFQVGDSNTQHSRFGGS